MPEPFAAQVMALEANYLRVRLDHPGPNGRRLLLCTRRARLAHGGLKVMVGDRVGVEGCDWIEGRAAVGSLEPRRNQLQRPALANVDQVLVVMALAQPAIDPESLSRFLLSAETAGAEVIPVLSKADLVSAEQQQQWLDRLTGWGYQALAISRHDPAGLAALADRLSVGWRCCVVPAVWAKAACSMPWCLTCSSALLLSRASCSAAATPPATWNCTICQRAGCWRTPLGSIGRSCLPILSLWRNSSLKSASSWRPVCAADFATAGICRSRAAACSGNGSATPATWS